MNVSVYDLREAAQRIRDTPRCVAPHSPCDCEFWEQTAAWLVRVADDWPVAVETALKVLAATEPAPKEGLDFLPEQMPAAEQVERAIEMFGAVAK